MGLKISIGFELSLRLGLGWQQKKIYSGRKIETVVGYEPEVGDGHEAEEGHDDAAADKHGARNEQNAWAGKLSLLN